MVRLLPVLLLIALAALPAAQAQTPADPTANVALEAKGTPIIMLGSSGAIKVDVQVSTNYIFCQNAGTFTVNLQLKDAGLAGVTGSIPASVSVPIAANVQPPQAKTNSYGNATALLQVTVAKTTTPDHDHSFTVVATTVSALPSGCSSLTQGAPKVSTATKDVTIKTGPAATNSTGGTGAGGTATKKSFFVPLQLELATLVGVGLLRRRKD